MCDRSNCIHLLRMDLLKGLSSHARLHILDLLVDGERTVCDMAEALGGNQSTVSNHLNTLRASGLVRTRREGTHVFYDLADRTAVKQMLEILDSMLKAQCRSASEMLEL